MTTLIGINVTDGLKESLGGSLSKMLQLFPSLFCPLVLHQPLGFVLPFQSVLSTMVLTYLPLRALMFERILYQFVHLVTAVAGSEHLHACASFVMPKISAMMLLIIVILMGCHQLLPR